MPFEKLDPAEWERTLRVNATGVFLTCKAALPHLVEGGGGSVVMTASTHGLDAHPGHAHYGASKHAVVGLMRALAREYAPHGVRVNCVCPGGVRTPMNREILQQGGVAPEDFDAVWTKVMAARVPLGSSVEPEDIGAAVVDLCRARMITGQALVVAGGEDF